jgi:hypothetical protein
MSTEVKKDKLIFEIIEKFIEVHKKANIKLAKKNGKLSGIETKEYENITPVKEGRKRKYRRAV